MSYRKLDVMISYITRVLADSTDGLVEGIITTVCSKEKRKEKKKVSFDCLVRCVVYH